MNSLSDTVLVAILEKLTSHRPPALGYLDQLQKKSLLPEKKRKLIHVLAAAIHEVTSKKKKQQLHSSLTHLKRLYHQEQQSRDQDTQDADLLLQNI